MVGGRLCVGCKVLGVWIAIVLEEGGEGVEEGKVEQIGRQYLSFLIEIDGRRSFCFCDGRNRTR